MIEWVQEPVTLARPGTLGDSSVGVSASGLVGWAILGLAVFGIVVLIKRY